MQQFSIGDFKESPVQTNLKFFFKRKKNIPQGKWSDFLDRLFFLSCKKNIDKRDSE